MQAANQRRRPIEHRTNKIIALEARRTSTRTTKPNCSKYPKNYAHYIVFLIEKITLALSLEFNILLVVL